MEDVSDYGWQDADRPRTEQHADGDLHLAKRSAGGAAVLVGEMMTHRFAGLKRGGASEILCSCHQTRVMENGAVAVDGSLQGFHGCGQRASVQQCSWVPFRTK